MSVGSLNLLKLLLHNVARGVGIAIGIAIGTEIRAGVVHADVLALDVAALLALALVLERLVAHDRKRVVEFRDESRLSWRLFFCFMRTPRGRCLPPKIYEKFMVDATFITRI